MDTIYDALERVCHAEMVGRSLRNREGWLGELEDSEESTDDADVLDLHNITSSRQFHEVQEEDAELQELQALVLDPSATQAVRPGDTPRFEVRNQLLYCIQPGYLWYLPASDIPSVISLVPILSGDIWAETRLLYRYPGGFFGQDWGRM